MRKVKLCQLLAVAGGLSAAVATTPVLAGDSVTLAAGGTAGGVASRFTVEFVEKSGNTWTYRVSQTSRALSHWSLGIENCEGKVSNPSPSSGFESGKGGASDSLLDADWMVKWNTGSGVSATGTLFSITLDGDYESTDVGVLVKTGGNPQSASGSVTGPDCSQPVVVVDDDADDDNVVDSADNCPNDANMDQTDVDGDGMGDACDATDDRPVDDDADDDSVVDSADNCPNDANMDQTDVDGDGTGDACDATDDRPVDDDADDDSVVDSADNCPNAANMDQADVDGDGTGDVCDATDDRPVDPVDDDEPVSGGGPNVLCSEIVASNGGPMSLITKFEWTGGGYAREGGTDAIDISGDASGGEWSVNDANEGIVDVDAVIIKGATGTYIYNYEPGAKVSDIFSKMNLPLNNGGQVPDISNVQFCQDGVLNGGDEVCLTVAGYSAPACVFIPEGTAYTISIDDAKYDVVAE